MPHTEMRFWKARSDAVAPGGPCYFAIQKRRYSRGLSKLWSKSAGEKRNEHKRRNPNVNTNGSSHFECEIWKMWKKALESALWESEVWKMWKMWKMCPSVFVRKRAPPWKAQLMCEPNVAFALEM